MVSEAKSDPEKRHSSSKCGPQTGAEFKVSIRNIYNKIFYVPGMPFSWKSLYFSHLGLVKKSLNAKLRNLYILYTKEKLKATF